MLIIFLALTLFSTLAAQSRVVASGRFSVSDMPGEFDVVLHAFTIPRETCLPLNSHISYNIVVEGALTVGGEIYRAGEKFVSKEDVVNEDPREAFLLRATLLQRGEPFFEAGTRFSVTTTTPFDLVMPYIQFPPGSKVPPHIHPGPVLTVVLAGECLSREFLPDGTRREFRHQMGEGFQTSANILHDHRNEGDHLMTELELFLIPQGAKPLVTMEIPS